MSRLLLFKRIRDGLRICHWRYIVPLCILIPLLCVDRINFVYKGSDEGQLFMHLSSITKTDNSTAVKALVIVVI